MQTTRKIAGTGGGKLILFGEHAVVYGHPAIVAGLGVGAVAKVRPCDEARLRLVDADTGAERANVGRDEPDELSRAFDVILRTFEVPSPVEINVVISLPIGAGLGSSAALATAVSRALEKFMGDPDAPPDQVDTAVAASEAVFHGNASGIDQAAAREPGVFEYRRTAEGPRTKPLDVSGFSLLVCRAGKAASTAKMVGRVRDLHTRQPAASFAIDEAIGELAATGAGALEAADWEAAGDLMNINHGLLCALGVSTLELDHACHVARRAGALGAKLTGSGGGGCVFAIAPGREDAVLGAWKQRGWPTWAYEL